MNRDDLKIAINSAIPSGISNAVSAEDVRETFLSVVDNSIMSEDLSQTTGVSTTGAMSQKAVTDALSAKQDTLSDSSLKTINNQSLLGPGNIDIEGGSGIQSNWDETDSTSEAFILNKPVIPDVSNFVTESELSSEFYTKTEVDTELSSKANSSDLSSVATSGSYNDLTDKPAIPSIDGLVTESQLTTELEDYYTKTEVDTELSSKANSSDLSSVATSGSYNDLTDKPAIPSIDGLVTESQLTTELEDYYTKTEVDTELSSKANSSDLSSVATSGSYNDLTDKPVIPSIDGLVTDGQLTTELEDYYTKTEVDTELSSKANSSDLSSVATSGSYNDLTDKPVIPSIDGLVTESQFNTGLSTKQSVLVSGINIKTVNDQSLLGSGNVATIVNEPTGLFAYDIIIV